MEDLTYVSRRKRFRSDEEFDADADDDGEDDDDDATWEAETADGCCSTAAADLDGRLCPIELAMGRLDGESIPIQWRARLTDRLTD